MLNQVSMRNIGLFSYSLICYVVTLLALVYFIVFCSGLYEPISVNRSGSDDGMIGSILINALLLLVFGVQHSVMARSSFKIWLARFIPCSVERSTYCLASALALAVIPFGWQAMDDVLWQLSVPWQVNAMHAGSALGWGILLLATFQIGHFELFGLKQSYDAINGKTGAAPVFKTPGLYRIVRHPIQLGVLLGIWLVPTATVSHFMLSVGMTAYVLIGLYFEEKDLVREFGQRYREYRQRVAKLIPFTV